MHNVADRLDIIDCLARYTRGVDRCDIEVLTNVFALGATVDLGSGPVEAPLWAKGIIHALLNNFLRTQHTLGQSIIDLVGDTACAETYVRAYHEMAGESGPVEMIVAGRYLDELVRTEAGWRIARRRYVLDWNQNGPSSAQWDRGLYATLNRRSARAPDDPSCTGE